MWLHLKGYSPWRRYPRSPFISKLNALFAGYANPASCDAGLVSVFLSATYETKKPPFWAVLYVAERKGFEPLIPVRVYTISSRAP